MYSRPATALRSIQPMATAAIRRRSPVSLMVAARQAQILGQRNITSPANEEFYLEHHHLENIPYSQGLCTNPDNYHPEDTMVQAVLAGIRARYDPNNLAIDAASRNPMHRFEDGGAGNPEGIGMIEQVGSANGTARFFAIGGIQGEPLVL